MTTSNDLTTRAGDASRPLPDVDAKVASGPTPRSSYREIVRALAAAQKPSKGAPAYSRFVNRRLGRLIAAEAFRLRLTPNMVTAISALFSFAGVALIAVVRPSWWLGILVFLCLVLGYAFDAADGQLARLQGGGRPSGEWLDHMVDATKISSLHLAVLISAYRFIQVPRAALLIPIGFTVVAAVMFFGMILNDQLRRQYESRTGKGLDRGGTSLVRSLLVIPTDYGLLCVVFILLAAPQVFFWVYAVLFAASAGFMALAAVKWFRDMKALD
ncbi:CDP-alcohol phosphatidyltransferase family protein [Nakamurella sp. PAMC28650]|uniref:CDP-alcohol phosphatidyltransferase family protein n=1 Tax=Nakamurella sp. PAMC28650 TaxID=2762325 RepID=UPI0021047FE1|nr:CDP-alcohol phosphatidyltransferase family protein [Nakamurella sp. PAMC28650]